MTSPNPENLLNTMIDSLSKASGSAAQLIHNKGGDPRWIVIRESIDSCKEIVSQVAGVQAMATLRNSK